MKMLDECVDRRLNRRPVQVCRNSIPGSNPGGASKFTVQIRAFAQAPRPFVVIEAIERPSPN
jgi:hypothetical protein